MRIPVSPGDTIGEGAVSRNRRYVVRARIAAAGAITALCGVGLLATGASAGPSRDNTHASGGTLRVGVVFTIDSLNPFVAVESTSLAVFKYIYPTLVQYNTKLQFVPSFARSWKTSANGLTWTFKLVPGARWSDGQPMTAQDVAWTGSTTLKYATGGAAQMATYLPGVKSVRAAGPNTVIFHLSSPQAAFLANLAQFPILPQHVWSSYATGKAGAGLKTFPNQPTSGPLVCGGPFVLTKYQHLGVVLFSKNPNFYGPEPSIDGFGLDYFSNSDAMIQALKTNQIDAILNLPVSGVRALKGDKNIALHAQTALNQSDLIINDNAKKKSHRELLNPLVREAFNYAIDRATIIKDAFYGYAKPAYSPIPAADVAWHDPAVRPPAFSLAKANQLLDKAGYKKGSNGVRIANGVPMSYKVILATDELGVRTRAFQIMQTDFAKIGVKLSVSVTDDSTAAALELSPSQKFDLGGWGWTPPADPSFMLNTYTCAQLGGWNETGYCNKQYDALFAKQARTQNVAARKKIVYQMQRLLAAATPEIIYVYEDWIDAWNKKWTGFGETPQGFFSYLTTEGLQRVHNG
jgi:peptide/nickel transport system substrate-binding protein